RKMDNFFIKKLSIFLLPFFLHVRKRLSNQIFAEKKFILRYFADNKFRHFEFFRFFAIIKKNFSQTKPPERIKENIYFHLPFAEIEKITVKTQFIGFAALVSFYFPAFENLKRRVIGFT